MNRLQKKCMLVSGGIHLLLAAMLIFGPAFLSSHNENAPPLLKFIPGATVEALMSGGGDNTVKNPPALATAPEQVVTPVQVTQPPAQVTPPAVVPAPPQKPERDPTPVVKETPRVDNTPKIDLTPTKPAPRKPREIDVDTRIVTSSSADAKAKRDAQAKAAAAAAAADQKRIATALGRAQAGIRGGVAGSTEIRIKGLGGGGVAYGNIKSAIYSRYFDAWKVPDGAPDLNVFVTITLARDGTVVSARITDRSGNSELDNSVQKALDRVPFVAPLPESDTQETREFSFGFNPAMKSSE